MQQSQNIEQYTEESPLAEEGRKLLHRVHQKPSKLGYKFGFEDDLYAKSMFLDLLLKEILYGLQQNCCVYYDIKKGCINDGYSPDPIHLDIIYGMYKMNRMITHPITTKQFRFITEFFYATKYHSIVADNDDEIALRDYLKSVLESSSDFKDTLKNVQMILQNKAEMPGWFPAEVKKYVFKYQLDQNIINADHCRRKLRKLLKPIESLENQIREESNLGVISNILYYYDWNLHDNKPCAVPIKQLLQSDEWKEQNRIAHSFSTVDFFWGGTVFIQYMTGCIDEERKRQKSRKVEMASKRTTNFKDYIINRLETYKEEFIALE